MSMGSAATLPAGRALVFAQAAQERTEKQLGLGARSILILNRWKRKAVQATPLTRDLKLFAGRWGIANETGRAAYLEALDLNWMLRRVALSMPTPPIKFFVDDQATLHSQQGPLFGRMVVSVHPQKMTTTREEFQGVVSEITSSWEDGDDGKPRLFCRTKTVGKQDVCDQRSFIDGSGKLTVETRLTKKPGAPTVVYDRVYEALPDEA